MASISKSRLRLDGKVAIITGGASGIGAATARLFVENGAKVIVADIQDQRGLSLCKELAGVYDDDDLDYDSVVSYVHCDVTSDSDVKNAVDTAVSKYGKLDIMYNNAGILGDIFDFSILSSSDNENIKKVYEVNVHGAFLGAKHAARAMVAAKSGGVILFTASTATVVAGESPYAYAMSKHAIIGLMRNLNVELEPHGIRVNCISPGAVLTSILNNSLKIENGVTEKLIRSVMPKGMNILHPEDVAKAAVYLSSDDSKFVTGLNFVVDAAGNTGKPSSTLTSALKDIVKLYSTFIKR